MKGFSLVSVLVALLILMAVLVPLMHFQGQIFSTSTQTHRLKILQAIEADYNLLKQEDKPERLKIWKLGNLQITREIQPIRQDLHQITYQASQDQKTILTLSLNSYRILR